MSGRNDKRAARVLAGMIMAVSLVWAGAVSAAEMESSLARGGQLHEGPEALGDGGVDVRFLAPPECGLGSAGPGDVRIGAEPEIQHPLRVRRD